MTERTTASGSLQTLTYFGTGNDIQVTYRSGRYNMTLLSHKEQGTVQVPRAFEYVHSLSSKSGYEKIPVFVKYTLREGKKPMRKPTPPRYPSLPDLPVLRPRRPNQSEAKYSAVVARFTRRYNRVLAFRVEALRAYREHLSLFQKRYAFWWKQQMAISYGVPVWKRAYRKSHTLQYNPYTRITRQFYPAGGTATLSTRMAGQNVDGSWTTETSSVHYTNQAILPPTSAWKTELTFPYPCGSTAWSWRGTEFVENFQAALSSCESRCWAQLSEGIVDRKVHVANIIAERHQTLQLLTTQIPKFVNELLAYRRKIWALPQRLRAIADATLAVQFGLKPLMQDIFDAISFLQGYDPLRRPLDTFVLRSRKSASNSFVQRRVYPRDGGNDDYEHCLKTTVKVKVSYVLEYQVNDMVMQQWLHSFGLINPAEVAWERMPWSFVIDWVIPIGNWLGSIGGGSDLTFKRGTKVVTTTVERELVELYKGVDTGSRVWSRVWHHGCYSGRLVETRKERTVLTSQPQIPFPEFKSPFSVSHIIDAIALLTQSLTGGSRRK